MLTLSNLAISQTNSSLQVSISKEYKDEVKSIDVIAIHTFKDEETAVVRNGKKSFLFDIFDNKLDKIFSTVIKSDKNERYVGDLFYNNQLKLFTVYAPKKDYRILYCHTLDVTTKTHKKTIVFETSVEKKQNLFGSRKNHNTSFSLSPNGNYFAIATDNVKKNKNSYTIRVFDAKTEKLIYKKAYQEDQNRNYEHNDLFLYDDTSVYSLGKFYLDGKSNKKLNGDANYQFVLNKITKDHTTELAINLDDEHIQSLNLFQSNNQLHILGFYSELNVDRIKGGCDFSIDLDDFSIKSKKTNALPKQVYEDLYGEKTAERKNNKKKELRNFTIDYTLTNADGSTFLIAEEFYITQVYVANGMTGGTWQTVYHYDDILILKFNANGNLSWGRSIFKRSNTPSYNAFIKDNKLHVILNSGKNLTEKKDGRTKMSKGWFESTALYDVEFTVNGDVHYNKIQDNKNKEFYLPYYGTYNTEKFIMMSSGRRKKTFMILQ